MIEQVLRFKGFPVHICKQAPPDYDLSIIDTQCLIEGICPFCNEKLNMDQIEDKKQFASGATSSGNLPPYECLTLTFLRRCAFRCQLGIEHGYEKHNWKKGSKDKKYILERLNHAVEHLHKLMSEIDNDIQMSDDDASAVAVNVMMAMEYQESQKSVIIKDNTLIRLDDPSFGPQPGLGRVKYDTQYDPKASQKASQ